MNTIAKNSIFLLIAVAFLAVVALNNQLFKRARIDLTQEQVYSLAEGTKAIIDKIEEPVNLYFFFSDQASEGLTGLRNYAEQVRSLLEEYSLYSDGKIKLTIIDPAPFSEQEDRAAEFGLTAAPVGNAGEQLYFGLAGRNALDDQQTIAFFDPQKESSLEYDISKLLAGLTESNTIKIGVYSGLDIWGSTNPMTGEASPPWTFLSQLEQLYQVERIDVEAQALPENLDVLMVIHPENMQDKMAYQLDQFVMKGGNLMLFVDPVSEASAPVMGQVNSSDLPTLFKAWGINYDATKVTLDMASGLEIRTASGSIIRHPGYLGLSGNAISDQELITSGLEVINGASFGAVSLMPQSTLSLTPLLTTTGLTQRIDAQNYAMSMQQPEELARNYSPAEASFNLAAVFSGPLQSAFSMVPEGIEESSQRKSTSHAHIVVITDTDLLIDRFWVQVENFFGQIMANSFANNGDLIANAVENLGGSQELIGIRSRGTVTRPFVKVQALTLKAEQRFREKELELQAQLEETEAELAQLQQQSMETDAITVSAEQQQTIEAFIQRKLEIRKALRDVRHQLDKDIEGLGSWLKFINIILAPMLMLILLLLAGKRIRRTSIGE